MADLQDSVPLDSSTLRQPVPDSAHIPDQRDANALMGETDMKDCGSPVKAVSRTPSVVKISDYSSVTTSPNQAYVVSVEDAEEAYSDSMKRARNDWEPTNMAETLLSREEAVSYLAAPSTVSDSTAITNITNESSSSGSSGSTVTPIPGTRSHHPGKPVSKQRRSTPHKPDALSFLEYGSPEVTPERIQSAIQKSNAQSPTSNSSASPTGHSVSSSSSGFRDDTFDVIGEHETDRSTSPERSVNGDPEVPQTARLAPPLRGGNKRNRSYGTPEMPRGNAQHPHISPTSLTPRMPNQTYVKHLPRAEKLPLTGYELLAYKLSTGSSRDQDHQGTDPYQVRPMYRRFETLNHRILLHLQDEICELEEQLHWLDTTDTQNRRTQSGMIPSSRRNDQMAPRGFQWQRLDTLGKIGWKLDQYNRHLASFQQTQSLPIPTLADIHEYRGYLAVHQPIAEQETRFLDATDDLVCLGASDEEEEEEEEREYDKISHNNVALDAMGDRNEHEEANSRPTSHHDDRKKGSFIAAEAIPHPLSATHLSLTTASAVIVPTLTFAVIPGYLGRMTVVFLVGLGVLGALVQGQFVGAGATRDLCLYAALYGGVMAVLAGVVT
ncbi:hypothetical protein F4778DRAFT_671474 [Xylariomycetidae sp. FL2044]|nr:hypothetical protein F4778DRAFT_671474 [Xylariomycetidae sp. FL2044]